MTPQRSRITGCLLGCAIGDALGQPVEAFPPAKLRKQYGEVREFMDGDPRLAFPLKAGQWTDDTQMTLDTVHSLVARCELDPADLASRFAHQHPEGLRFSGFNVTQAVRRLRRGVPWDKSGLGADYNQGNGAVMRIAPIGLYHCLRPIRLAADVWTVARITHTHPEAVAAAQAIAAVVAAVVTAACEPSRVFEVAVLAAGETLVSENLRVAQHLLAQDTPTAEALEVLGTTGWAVHTAAAALYCFARTPDNFEQTVVAAVMGGHDADTTAAVAGAISGAWNGAEKLPRRFREGVERGDEIEALGDELHGLIMQTARVVAAV